MSEDLDKIMGDIEAEKKSRIEEQKQAKKMLQMDEETANRVLEERKNKISGFKLSLDLEEKTTIKEQGESKTVKAQADMQIPKTVPIQNTIAETAESASKNEDNEKNTAHVNQMSKTEQNDQNDTEKKNMSDNNGKKKKWKDIPSWVRGIIYTASVLVISVLLAYILIAAGFDYTGLNKSDTKVPVTLTEEQCQSTAQVAKILEKAGVIDHPLFFQLYCKIKKVDGTFEPQDEATVSADMGYEAIINVLKSNARNIVKLTFTEGCTVKEIAKQLEDNNVCSSSDFYTALNSDKYTYDFLGEIPVDDAHNGRFYKMEGYLFPDTYQFYVNSSGETVVKKFLDNFNNRVDVTTRAAIKAKGMTLNDTIILASIIQWEGNDRESMQGISCVLHNRLNDLADYPHLECDSTTKYVRSILDIPTGQAIDNSDYDSYVCTGLPVGAINNPGLDAIDAAVNPATEGDAVGCYYFAADMKNNKMYYSKTLQEHEAKCKKYDIGMYASSK